MDDIYTLSDSQLCKRLGEKLKAIRLKRNITQQSLAEASSVSLSSLFNWPSAVGGSVVIPTGHLNIYGNEQLGSSENRTYSQRDRHLII